MGIDIPSYVLGSKSGGGGVISYSEEDFGKIVFEHIDNDSSKVTYFLNNDDYGSIDGFTIDTIFNGDLGGLSDTHLTRIYDFIALMNNPNFIIKKRYNTFYNSVTGQAIIVPYAVQYLDIRLYKQDESVGTSAGYLITPQKNRSGWWGAFTVYSQSDNDQLRLNFTLNSLGYIKPTLYKNGDALGSMSGYIFKLIAMETPMFENM